MCVCKPAKHGRVDGPGREPHSYVSLIFEYALPLGTTTGPDFGEVGSSAGVDLSKGFGAAWGDYDGMVSGGEVGNQRPSDYHVGAYQGA